MASASTSTNNLFAGGVKPEKKEGFSSGLAIASFLFAAAQNDLGTIEQLLQDKVVSVNDCDYDKRTALHLAASEGCLDIVRALLREGADVNIADRYGSTPLDDAIRHGQAEVAKLLQENGANNSHNFALDLVNAAATGDLNKVVNLVESGISPTSPDYDGRTPLHVAIAGRHYNVVKYLLDRDASAGKESLYVEDKFGGTPIEEAHRAGVRLGEDPIMELINSYTGAGTHHLWRTSLTNSFFWIFLVIELIIGALFAIFSEYGPGATSRGLVTDGISSIVEIYPFYMDVHVMIFIGFGYLMTFLRKYGYTAVGLTFMLGSLSIQVYLLASTLWEDIFSGIYTSVEVNVVNLIRADFCAGAVLISFGALLGKVTFSQMLGLAVIESFFYSLNEAIANKLAIADIGGSMVIHVFGAFFGLAASFVMTKKGARGNRDNAAVYHSDVFSMIGTIFLWMFWPSFNGALGVGNTQHRAVVNTLLSLTASCVFAFLFSQFWRKERQFNMVDIQNATLAGGVAMGSAADYVLHPAFALLIGAIAGTISVLGFAKLQGVVEQKLRIHDTCGVLNLHGMPGIIGAVVSMIAAAAATESRYSQSQLQHIFPDRDGTRTAGKQGQFQLAFLAITLGIAILTGLLSGLLMSFMSFPKKFFVDSENWETPARTPYYFDHRGEVQHSKDKVVDGTEKTQEKGVAGLQRQITFLENAFKENKRTLREQGKTIDQLQARNGGGNLRREESVVIGDRAPLLGGNSNTTQRNGTSPLASALESLTNKINFLVDERKRQ